ncbi:MAG TPA: hypothetical protein VMT43_07630 [Acidimicrobiales bacterium]|nr:hypothetical protein [Acidimicrobiales bacterium]
MRIVRRFSGMAAAVGLVGVLLASQPALAATITNGGFETGDFTGWTVDEQSQSGGTWSVYTGTSTPDSQHDIDAPPCDTHAAIFDQEEPSSAVLYQDLTLAAGDTHTLSFTHYYRNYATTNPPELKSAFSTPQVDDTLWASPATLDYSIDGDNQQYRVDIMKPTADPMSVDPADILKSVFQTEPGDPADLAPTPVTVDLSAFAGQTVRLRFAAVDNSYYLNVGVDCVQLVSTPIATSTTSTTTTTVPSTTTTAAVPVQVEPAFTG